MYQYDRGVKKKNVGYARIEARNGQCKITLHLQLLGQSDSIFPTYLIQRDEKGMELIYLGDSVLRNQLMESKLTADENNIMDSGYGLSDIGGLLIFLNDDIFFATEWDDRPIIHKEVMEALKPKEENQCNIEKEELINSFIVKDIDEEQQEKLEDNQELMEKPEDIGQDLFVKLKETDDVVVTEVLQPKLETKIIEVLEQDMEEKPFLVPFDELVDEENQDEVLTAEIKQSEENEEIVNEEVDENNIIAAETNLSVDVETNSLNNIKEQRDEMPRYTLHRLKKEDKKKPKIQSIELDSDVDMDKIQDEIEKYEKSDSNSTDDVSGMSANCNCMNDQTEEVEPPLASRIFESYPRIYPFEDNEVIKCVKIEPKDIGILPMDAWALSNNSFLLHSFYCYHHLIFGKIKDRFGCRYILGVPGIYHNRERFMGKMFGFENFKSVRKRELKQGDFGYWYLPIEM